MVTDAQSDANARTAARRVAARLGLDPLNLTFEQREVYTNALANEILAYPQSFTPDDLARARAIAGQPLETLEDDSFQWVEAISGTVSNSAPVLEGFTNKLLWILAAGFLFWIFLNSRPPGASAARA